MNVPVSNVTVEDFDNQISGMLPKALTLSSDRRRAIISSVVTKINSLYVNNDKGIYIDTITFYFYNSAKNDFINIRDLTRWTGISGDNLPDGFRAVKLLGCNLKEVLPDFVEYPVGVSYIQDIKINVDIPLKTVTTSVPAANTGNIALVETNRLITSLTLGSENSWTNVLTIEAVLSFYRNPILPRWSGIELANQYIDILPKDFDLAYCYVEREIFGNSTSFKTLRDIENYENDIKYKL